MKKTIEGELRVSEEKYRGLFVGFRDAIMILEPPTWKFTSGNPATLEMFRAKSEAEFLSYEPWKLSPDLQPDGRASGEKAKEMIEKAMREGSNFFEWVHKRISGEEFFADVLLSKVVQDGNEFLLAVVRDISKRKNTEEKLSEEWEKIFNAIGDLIFVQDKDCNILRVNKACAETLNMDPKDIIGRKCYEVIHNSDHHWPGCPFMKSAQDQKNHTEEVNDPHLGAVLLVTVSPVLGVDGEFIGAVHIAKDISERKRVEEEKNVYLQELELFYKASIGREERILELKKTIEELTKELDELKKNK